MFKDLPGHYQRALLNEAEIRYNGHQMSRYCKLSTNKDEFLLRTAESLEKDVKKYVLKDSKTLYLFPLKKDRDSHYEQQSREYADMLDRNYVASNLMNLRIER